MGQAYDFTLILRLPDVDRATAARYRRSLAANRGKTAGAPGIGADEEADFKDFGRLETDLEKVVASAKKKFDYPVTGYRVSRTTWDGGPRMVSRDFASYDAAGDEAGDTGEITVLRSDEEAEGREVVTADLYKDGVTDDQEALRQAMRRLMDPSKRTRLSIFGHGTLAPQFGGWACVKVGGLEPDRLAGTLAIWGLSAKEKYAAKPERVSLVSCFAGRTFEIATEGDRKVTLNYARELHKLLRRNNWLETSVSARVGLTQMRQERGEVPAARYYGSEDAYGTVATRVWRTGVDTRVQNAQGSKADYAIREPGTKVTWFWEDGAQRRLDPYDPPAADA